MVALWPLIVSRMWLGLVMLIRGLSESELLPDPPFSIILLEGWIKEQ
jgi:hypothetical protein